MTLVEDPPGVWRCRVDAVRPAVAPGAAQRLIDAPRAFAAALDLHDTTPLPALVEGLLRACEMPIEFDRLVDAVGVILGISDATGPEAEEQVDPSATAQVVLEHRASLQMVWKELVRLPTRQRSALLLNMRDPQGGGVLDLLPATGVVTMADIASALEVSLDQLGELWARLPLDDLTIATRLGITRQQVINLRKSGRARLARRLGGNIASDAPSSRSMGLGS